MTEPARTDSEAHADVVAMPPLIYLISVLAGVVASWLFGGTIAGGSSFLLLAGGVLLVAGLAGSLRFVRVFQQMGQDRNPRTATPRLAVDGIYGVSRNPAYVSITAIQIGLALLLDNPWILAALLPALVVMHYGVILREEAYLERTFGEEYQSYKARVRRWL